MMEQGAKLNTYRFSKLLEDWKEFKKIVKKTKHIFFNDKIQEIALKNKRPWDFINQVKKYKIPAIEALQYIEYLYIELDNLWQALYQMFNLAQNWWMNIQLLDELPSKSTREQPKFSKEKFRNVIHKYNSFSTSGPD